MTVAPLDGHRALVTGCARQTGIGRATALALAAAGADVAVADLSLGGTRNAGEAAGAGDDWGGLAALVDEIKQLGRRSVAVVGDVGHPESAEHLVQAAADGIGPLDVLVNNAAAPHSDDRTVSWQVPVDAWDQVLRVNARGAFLMSTAFVRQLLGRQAPSGRIVNIASVAGLRGLPQRAAYSASKAAIVSLTQAMAGELRGTGVTVNVVCPGGIETPRHLARSARPGAPNVPGGGSIGSPADVARAVLFLAEPAAAFVSGQVVVVDGG